MLLAFCWLNQLVTSAQAVSNDAIERRLQLPLEELISSSTTGCTVQRGCVDERLTGKCIQYHNDQWFEFTPTVTGRYFVNISQQNCRDVQGVQLVVLTGQPCQPATYQILSCTSLGTQDDVFIMLDSLRASQPYPYLLNVDGYLKDFCRFTLQLSRQARGLPVVPASASPAAAISTGSHIVELAWQLPDSLAAATHCQVLRREQHAFRSAIRQQLPISRDTYGSPLTSYTTTDTLTGPGIFCYQIVANTQPPLLLQQRWVSFGQPKPAVNPLLASPHLTLPLNKYPRNARLSVVITEPLSGRVLLNLQLINRPSNVQQGWVPVGTWQEAGLQKVAVEITCHPPHGRFFTDRLLLDVPSPAAGR
jgi:hypothetical protein